MKQTALAILAPAAAIVLAALLQQLLVTVFPTVQTHSIGMVSLDSHLEVVAMLGLSFCAAYLIKRSVAGRGVLIASLLFPTAVLVLILASQPLALSSHIAHGMNGVRINLLLLAISPLLGTVLAYVVPSDNRLERSRGLRLRRAEEGVDD
jgi:hypothetical protein